MKIIDHAQSIIDNMRYYDNQKWHAVNVKRYNDSFVLNTNSEYKEELQSLFDSMEEYSFFLETEWNQLKYELSDLHNIFNKGDKNYHVPFEYVDLNSLHLNGRSGGLACFDSDLDSIMNEFDYENNQSGPQDLGAIKKCVNEIEFISDYISNYNKNLKYQDYVDAHIEIREDEIKEKIKRSQIKTITPLISSQNPNISRHAKGILKELQK